LGQGSSIELSTAHNGQSPQSVEVLGGGIKDLRFAQVPNPVKVQRFDVWARYEKQTEAWTSETPARSEKKIEQSGQSSLMLKFNDMFGFYGTRGQIKNR